MLWKSPFLIVLKFLRIFLYKFQIMPTFFSGQKPSLESCELPQKNGSVRFSRFDVYWTQTDKSNLYWVLSGTNSVRTIKRVKQCSTHQNKLYTLLIMDLKTWINFNYNWSGSGDISTLVPAGGGEQDWEDAGQFSQAHQLTLPAQPCQQCTLRLLRQVQNLFSSNYN